MTKATAPKVGRSLLNPRSRWLASRWGLVGLLCLVPASVGATSSDPCVGPNNPSATNKPVLPGSGFLILQLSRTDIQSSQIFEGTQALGRLPSRTGYCTWLPLSPGEHTLRIGGMQEMFRISARRTTFVSLNENPAGTVRYPLRFAFRLAGTEADFPSELRTDLRSLAAHADTRLSDFDLADEESRIEPQGEATVLAGLTPVPAPCNPQAFSEEATLHFVLVLSRRGAGYRVRAYNTAVGASEPAADLDESHESAAVCRSKSGAAHLQCLLLQALKQARTRGHYCLQVATQPTDAQVQLTALVAPNQPVGKSQPFELATGGRGERTLMGSPSGPLTYRLSVEHPRFLPQERTIDFSEQMVQSVSISLQPRSVQVAAVPLYKKWWLWQSVATAVVVGVTGTVAGIYSSDRGTR